MSRFIAFDLHHNIKDPEKIAHRLREATFINFNTPDQVTIFMRGIDFCVKYGIPIKAYREGVCRIIRLKTQIPFRVLIASLIYAISINFSIPIEATDLINAFNIRSRHLRRGLEFLVTRGIIKLRPKRKLMVFRYLSRYLNSKIVKPQLTNHDIMHFLDSYRYILNVFENRGFKSRTLAIFAIIYTLKRHPDILFKVHYTSIAKVFKISKSYVYSLIVWLEKSLAEENKKQNGKIVQQNKTLDADQNR